ncbi:MAG: hypothetical protein NTY19_42100 [Planctomycetota bacterium]|nr:hypothetical protein [Planctomycetota bacterium]
MSSTAIVVCIIFSLTLTPDYTDKTDTGHPQLTRPAKFKTAIALDARVTGRENVIAFIEPPQSDVLEKLLRGHRRAAMVGGLWCSASPRAPLTEDGWVHDPDGAPVASDEFRELTFLDEATFWATF